MKALILGTLLLLAFNSYGNINPASLHLTDCLTVSSYLQQLGYAENEFLVTIQRVDGGGVSYFVNWAGERWNSSDEDYELIAAAIISSGTTSQETSWYSSMICVGFTNKCVIITSADARWFISNGTRLTDYEASRWFLNNVVFLDI